MAQTLTLPQNTCLGLWDSYLRSWITVSSGVTLEGTGAGNWLRAVRREGCSTLAPQRNDSVWGTFSSVYEIEVIFAIPPGEMVRMS